MSKYNESTISPIEVLVILAIIAILSAILYPAVQRARAAARGTSVDSTLIREVENEVFDELSRESKLDRHEYTYANFKLNKAESEELEKKLKDHGFKVSISNPKYTFKITW